MNSFLLMCVFLTLSLLLITTVAASTTPGGNTAAALSMDVATCLVAAVLTLWRTLM
ncbi:hypothetical protein DPMN_103509 [Dreissena polymorpha]|uniref:Uncharacterized protein n=1 Tax=Dreissena polymorpha TaxID=45954 RepID=A0A9D4K2N8_DREPO|nr:hypothetical protein DPMN_103509 [Dreissena polymorpha]